MSARINLAENTRETNRDTCGRIPPAPRNKLLEGKRLRWTTEPVLKIDEEMKAEDEIRLKSEV